MAPLAALALLSFFQTAVSDDPAALYRGLLERYRAAPGIHLEGSLVATEEKDGTSTVNVRAKVECRFLRTLHGRLELSMADEKKTERFSILGDGDHVYLLKPAKKTALSLGPDLGVVVNTFELDPLDAWAFPKDPAAGGRLEPPAEVRFAEEDADSGGMRKILVVREKVRLELSIRKDGLLAAATRIEEKNGVRERAEWVFSASELLKEWPKGEKLPSLPAGYTVQNLPGPFEKLLPEGSPAPEVTLQTLEGKKFHLADLSGRTVLLTFWFAHCGPCRAELPQIEAFWKAIRKERDDFAILAVDLRDTPETVKQIWKEEGFTFPAVLQKDDDVSQAFGVVAYPTVYLIGPDGKILYRNLAFVEGHIRKRLPPPDPAPAEARKWKLARLQLHNLAAAVDLFSLMQGSLPGSLQDLLRPGQGSGAPLMNAIPKDPWGNDYFYRAIPDTRGYELLSFGADGKRGGTGSDADVVWDRKD